MTFLELFDWISFYFNIFYETENIKIKILWKTFKNNPFSTKILKKIREIREIKSVFVLGLNFTK